MDSIHQVGLRANLVAFHRSLRLPPTGGDDLPFTIVLAGDEVTMRVLTSRFAPTLRSPSLVITAETIFAHSICIACLIFQRFGLTLGSGSQLAASLVIAPAALFMIILTGKARVNQSALIIFVLATISTLLTTFLTILYPDFAFRFSLMSVIELGILYVALVLKPSPGFDGSRTLGIFVFWARIIAVAGLMQYALQFAHLRLFSFLSLHIPSAILLESTYHVVAPIAYGSSILRSNGFFLLEPSILSQVMALACLVDGFVRRRYRFLPLYGAALLASFSGTGVLILVAATLLAGALSPRQIPRVLILAVVGAIAVAAAALIFPNQFATLAARANGNDPSAQARYLEQVTAFNTLSSDQRLVLGFGPGSADGFVRLGSLSPASKILFDYGLVGAVLFVFFLVSAWWRFDQPVLTLGALLAFQFGGGYLLFPPMVYLVTLICIWSRPSDLITIAKVRHPWSRSAGLAAST